MQLRDVPQPRNVQCGHTLIEVDLQHVACICDMLNARGPTLAEDFLMAAEIGQVRAQALQQLIAVKKAQGSQDAQDAKALEARSLHRDRDRCFPGRPKASECRGRTIDVGPVSHRCVCHPGA